MTPRALSSEVGSMAKNPDVASVQDRRRRAYRRVGNRVVRLGLDSEHFKRLERMSADVGIRVDQLASLFLRERIDRSAYEGALVSVYKQLSQISEGATSGKGMTTGRRRGTRELDGSGRPSGQRRVSQTRKSKRGGGLHDEIISVLHERGEPMTAAEIAAGIRKRGKYRAPRSGQPITGALVSRRVSNPHYRPLFARSGRRLALAAGMREG
jgi:hypothetical protein